MKSKLILNKVTIPKWMDDYPEMESTRDYIIRSILKMQEDFYKKLAFECLGREADLEKDQGRFEIHIYQHLNNKKVFCFDGVEVGEIKENDFNENPNITFNPYNLKS